MKFILKILFQEISVHIFQQSRTDRDEFVLIRWENVDNGLQGYLSRNRKPMHNWEPFPLGTKNLFCVSECR